MTIILIIFGAMLLLSFLFGEGESDLSEHDDQALVDELTSRTHLSDLP